MFDLPNSLFDLVDDDGGGGLWICAAVGARDWRIEYVRCIFADGCLAVSEGRYRFVLVQ